MVRIRSATPRLRDVDAGFDEVYVQQIGGNHEKFFRTWADEVLPALR